MATCTYPRLQPLLSYLDTLPACALNAKETSLTQQRPPRSQILLGFASRTAYTRPAASHTATAALVPPALLVGCSPCLVLRPAALLGFEQARGAVEWSGGGKEQTGRARFIYLLPWPVLVLYAALGQRSPLAYTV
jgi:hypothetical protein